MRRFEVALLLCCQLGWGACGGDESQAALPYTPNATAVIGVDADDPQARALRSVKTPDGDECIDFDDACVQPQKTCGDGGTADVLVGADGRVLDVICYPTSGVAVESFDGPVQDVGNNVVLVFDEEDDGADVTGDVTIDGNNVTLYGQGPDSALIQGNLHIAKNNTVVRGIRVAGDVTIDKNNPSIVNCVIEGDLTIRANNVSVALCEVWGKITIDGNNTVLVDNRFATVPTVNGHNTLCSQNRSFADADADGQLSNGELLDAVECTDSDSVKDK